MALVAGICALGALVVVVGLDRADKLASVVGAVAGVLSLGLASYVVVRERRSAAPPPGAQSQEVSRSTATNVAQIRAAGDVTIRRPGSAPSAGAGGDRRGAGDPPRGRARRDPPASLRQSVADSQPAGDVFQIDGAGDVRWDR